jgi:hypothetical protein
VISKHIDLLAVGVLLLGMALFTQKRPGVLFRLVPSRMIVMPQRPERPVFVMPEIPSVPFHRG